MVIDETGSRAGIKRHDYAPFGEKLGDGVGIRSASNGYSDDSVRQKFTGSERDSETGLDLMGARYCSSAQGRFTTTDPLLASGNVGNPQSWNRYSYAFNNPMKYTDPTGMDGGTPSPGGGPGNHAWDAWWRRDMEEGTALEQQQRNVYVFLTFTTGEQGTSAPVTTGSETQTVNIPAPSFESLDDKVPAGTKVTLLKGTDVTDRAVTDALQDPNAAAVIFIGHAAGTRDAASGVFSASGIQLGNDREFNPGGTPAQVRAQNVMVFACDSKSIKGDFALGTGQSYVGVDSAREGYTSTAALSRAGFSAARALIGGRGIDSAVAAANGALTPRTSDRNPAGGPITLSRAVIDQGDKIQRVP
jgi:RHS repeat-associated protein